MRYAQSEEETVTYKWHSKNTSSEGENTKIIKHINEVKSGKVKTLSQLLTKFNSSYWTYSLVNGEDVDFSQVKFY